VVVHRAEGVGSASARNLALEAATGDIVVYLDDDNVFDQLWLKAVVWAFDQRPEVDVLYGARIMDDEDRIRRVGSGALPKLHFDPWDRPTIEDHNIVDLGTVAHRSKLTEARFDPQLSAHDDWDLILRITKDHPPLPLPVLALYYSSDAPNRLGDGDLSDQALVRAKLESDDAG
jgi:O-antigen biosynthesis protein